MSTTSRRATRLATVTALAVDSEGSVRAPGSASPFRPRLDSAGRGRSVLVVVLGLLAGVAGAEAPARAETNGGAYTAWTWPAPPFASSEGLSSVEQDVTIESTTPDAGYFWAEQIWWRNNPTAGSYMGLQSAGQRRTDGSVGDTAIFSVWEAIDARGPGCGVFAEPTPGLSCSLAYDWVQGRSYRYSVRRGGGDDTGTWWAASIVDLASGERTVVGEIKVRAPSGGIDSTQNFTEYFASPLRSCETQPYSRVHFGRPRANDGGVIPAHRTSEQPASGCYVIDEPDGGVTHEVGDPRQAPAGDPGSVANPAKPADSEANRGQSGATPSDASGAEGTGRADPASDGDSAISSPGTVGSARDVGAANGTGDAGAGSLPRGGIERSPRRGMWPVADPSADGGSSPNFDEDIEAAIGGVPPGAATAIYSDDASARGVGLFPAGIAIGGLGLAASGVRRLWHHRRAVPALAGDR